MDGPTSHEQAASASWDDVVRDLRRERVGGASLPEAAGRHRGTDGARSRRLPLGRVHRSAAAVATVAVLLGSGLAVARAGADGPDDSRPPVAVAATSWTAVLRHLDATRVRAWESADQTLLRNVDAAGSAAERADLTVLAALRRDAVRPAGLSTEVITVGVVSKREDAVRLRVVDRRSAYDLRSTGTGRVVRSVPARAARAWEVRLGRVAAGWRVVDVVALGP